MIQWFNDSIIQMSNDSINLMIQLIQIIQWFNDSMIQMIQWFNDSMIQMSNDSNE